MSDTSSRKTSALNPSQEDMQTITALYNKGLLGQCLEHVSCLIDTFPNSANLFNIKGVIVKNMSDFEEALGCFQQAIILDPEYYKALTNLGNTYQELGRHGLALESYKKAIVLNQDYPEVYNNMGNCLKARGDLRGAEESFSKAIELKHDFFQARYNLANVLDENGESERALSELQRSLDINPDFSEAHVSIGNILKKQGELSASADSYRIAIGLNPKSSNAYINLGSSLSMMEAHEDAIKVYKELLRIESNNDNALANMGHSLMKINDYGAAISSFVSACKIDPTNGKYLNQLGAAYREIGSLDLAIEQFQRASQIEPLYAESYFNMSAVFRQKSDFRSELSSLKKTLSLNPEHINALNDLGSVHLRNRNFSESVAHYSKAIKIQPSSNLHLNLGLALKEMGDLDGAILNFNEALSLNSENSSAQHFLDVASGVTTASAPREYVESLFDSYAETFDDSLVQQLDYKIPSIIADLLRDKRLKEASISALDLGCGTGLVGKSIAEFCTYLEGVDLSSSMIERAEKTSVYDKLVHDDIVQYLKRNVLDFDFFICADVFVYLGDLREVVNLIQSKSRKAGTLIFSVETSEKEGFRLEHSGRYSHSENYIEKLATDFGYTIQQMMPLNVRKEYGSFIKGALYVLHF